MDRDYSTTSLLRKPLPVHTIDSQRLFFIKILAQQDYMRYWKIIAGAAILLFPYQINAQARQQNDGVGDIAKKLASFKNVNWCFVQWEYTFSRGLL